ncbi:SDR family oxidoreductase [Roseospira marina]|uniref:SDR family oxidoreductase n=1 Tax=Roseospira marina TaxID=140057 RepID=A0A5M6IDS4_9PROT|nr:SDR family oxidoreductase [Roseospira marina]KAA5606393.1 SDR family oxidoreductase [Roseospira marina]MBB4314200.1 NAD(P)-dependent dehydrogenase (short-subunit alcohol dehydrogenase family) [Roseospira marina]MBB5087361.1 NAD(P)-dependent dehydrogenase (short-subunit alcohol dehydrogenase family) [Roseospira marina]
MTDKVWFITGAGRGLGYLLARDALKAGDKVLATSQSVDGIAESLSAPNSSLLVLPLDVTDPGAASAAHDAAIETFGRIDVLVNNAGRAQLGWFETIPEEDVRRQFEINLFGAMNVARAVLPTMRRQRSGLVVTISSVNGLVSNPGGSVYSASKFALEGWMEGLAEEIAPLGIRSLIVEPGMMRTNFLDPTTARQGNVEIADYAEAVEGFRSFVEQANGAQQNDPEDLAALIVAEASSLDPARRLLFGADAHEWASAKCKQLAAEIEASSARG